MTVGSDYAVNKFDQDQDRDKDTIIAANGIAPKFETLRPVDLLNEVNGSQKSLASFDHLRVTLEKEYPNASPIITWGGSGIASPGNVTGISAQSKAGKTAVIGVLAAGSVSQNGFVDGFSDIVVVPNPDGKAVIVFDTEQSESDQQDNVRTICKRIGSKSTPPNLLSYNIRKLLMTEYQEITNGICEVAASEFNGIYSIFVDGIADYIKDINNTEQSTAIREYFTQLSIKYSCPVIVAIHQNPGSTKERGHLGTILQMKCYGFIQVVKNNGISVAKSAFTRKAGELKPIHFMYSLDKGYHIEIDADGVEEKAKEDKELRKIQELRDLFQRVMPQGGIRRTPLDKLIAGEIGRSEDTGKLRVTEALKYGIITKGKDEHFRLAD